ncbi:hypothetical protein BD309DRAFT_690480 [Dichomitus squalens]|nr:hypothetical protein BD309DRAFT_690480 [Dichomitus squalens]
MWARSSSRSTARRRTFPSCPRTATTRRSSRSPTARSPPLQRRPTAHLATSCSRSNEEHHHHQVALFGSLSAWVDGITTGVDNLFFLYHGQDMFLYVLLDRFGNVMVSEGHNQRNACGVNHCEDANNGMKHEEPNGR